MRFLLIALACLGAISCRYNSEEALYPPGNCNTDNVTYSTTISGIINSNGCLTCHGDTNPVAGFSLTTYAGVKAKVTDGRLYGAVNHLPGFSPMPQGGTKISQCDINKIKRWIDDGALNN